MGTSGSKERIPTGAGDDTLDDFELLFIAQCVGHSSSHGSFPLEFSGLGTATSKSPFLKKTEPDLSLTMVEAWP